jgi:hypothetical protein
LRTTALGPRWSADGKELFYVQSNVGLFVVEIKARNAPNQFEAGLPKPVTRSLVSSFDVTRMGSAY